MQHVNAHIAVHIAMPNAQCPMQLHMQTSMPMHPPLHVLTAKPNTLIVIANPIPMHTPTHAHCSMTTASKHVTPLQLNGQVQFLQPMPLSHRSPVQCPELGHMFPNAKSHCTLHSPTLSKVIGPVGAMGSASHTAKLATHMAQNLNQLLSWTCAHGQTT